VLAKKVMSSGIEAHGDFHIYTSFNTDAWLYCSMSRFEQNGKPHLMFVFQDITVRKQAEMELKDLAEHFQVLANTTMDAFWIVDEDGIIIDVNARTSIVYGYTKEEMLGKHVKAFTIDQDTEASNERVNRIIADGYYRFESSHQTKNGSTILVEVSASRIPNTHRFLAFIKDITARKEAEQKTLQERDDKYRLLFDTMAQGVVFQEADGRISSANPAAEQILGLSLEQMLGKTSIDPGWRTIRVDGTELSGHDHPSMIAVRTGKPVYEYILGVFNPKKEVHTWLSVTAIPLFQLGVVAPCQVYTIFSVVKELQNNCINE
jgi:PAS domain S-box-containing protein